jgi:hypothetical protein
MNNYQDSKTRNELGRQKNKVDNYQNSVDSNFSLHERPFLRHYLTLIVLVTQSIIFMLGFMNAGQSTPKGQRIGLSATAVQPKARGNIFLVRGARTFQATLQATGLSPNKPYVFTLNGYPGQAGNEALGHLGKFTGDHQGYVDIVEDVSQPNGTFDCNIDFKLPPGDYKVKFLVKRRENKWPVVLSNNLINFTILASNGTAATNPKSPSGHITSPIGNELVDRQFTVSGTVSNIPDGRHIWVVEKVGNLIWPKEPEIDTQVGDWEVTVYEGGNPQGGRLSILLLMVDSKTSKSFTNLLQQGHRSGYYPGQPLPQGVKQLDSVKIRLNSD